MFFRVCWCKCITWLTAVYYPAAHNSSYKRQTLSRDTGKSQKYVSVLGCNKTPYHPHLQISLKKKKNHQIQRVKHTYLTIVLELNYSYQSQNNIIKQCHYIVLGYNCSNYINKSSCRLYLW